MTLETFIARRYFSSRQKPFFVWLLTFISLLGMATSVFALVLVLAIMRGFEEDFQKKIIAFKAPLTLKGPSGLDWSALGARCQALDFRIRIAFPFVEGEAVLQSAEGDNVGVRVRGVTGELVSERFGDLRLSDTIDSRMLVMGRELSHSLFLDPDSFDRVRLIFPFGEVGPTGELMPLARSYSVGGTFRTGFYDFDSKQVLLLYPEAVKLLGEYGRYGLEVWVEPLSQVSSVQQRLARSLTDIDSLSIQTWRDQNPKLFAALKLERIGMFLLLAVLVVIASATLFGLMSLTVLDRLHDTAVLRTLGLSPRRVRAVFLLQAAGIGLLGDLAGLLVGLGLVGYLIRHPLTLPSTYYVNYLPVTLDWAVVVGVAIVAPLVALVAALYPARQATQPSLVELLRHE